MVELHFKNVNLPENFHGIKVDVYPTKYGNQAYITLLMKGPFTMEDSDFLHEISKDAKDFVKKMFGEYLKGGITSSNSTIDNYNRIKGWYEEQKKLNENMKNKNIIITESRFKTFIEDKLGIDLTGKVDLVTNKWELPMEFDRIITPTALNSYLNRFGPMYSIENGDTKYLYQDQGDRSVIADTRDRLYTESEILNKLGFPPLGIKLKEILDLYV
jgi:hypothetical protein